DVRVQPEEDRDLFDGQREAAELADDLPRVILIPRGWKAAGGEVIDDQTQGVVGIERIDLDSAELLPRGAARMRIEPGRGDNPQPVDREELAQLRGREQARFGDVVQDEQG